MMGNRIALIKPSEPLGAASTAVAPLAVSGRDLPTSTVVGPRLEPRIMCYPGALFAFIVDDGGTDLETPGAGGLSGAGMGTVTPYQLLVALGMPIGVAFPSDWIGTTNHYTAAQLRVKYWRNGWSVLSHSKTHADPPTTAQQIYDEIVGSKLALESLQDTSFTAHPDIGIRCNLFVQPGTWGLSNASLTSAPGVLHTALLGETAADTTDAIAVDKDTSSITGVGNPIAITLFNRTGGTSNRATVNFTVTGTRYDGTTTPETISISGASTPNLNGYVKIGTVRWRHVTSIQADAAQPSGWTVAVGIAAPDAYCDNPLKMGGAVWQAVRQNYCGSFAYLGGGQERAHSFVRYTFPTVEQVTTDAVAGNRVIYYFHANVGGGSYATPSTFYDVVTTIASLRAQGLCQVVTPESLIAAVPGDTTPSYLCRGTFDDWDYAEDTNLTQNGAVNRYGWYLYQPSGNSTIYMRGDGNGNKWLELTQDSSNAVQIYRRLYGAIPGRAYRIYFDAKLANPGSSLSYLTVRASIYDENKTVIAPDNYEIAQVMLDGSSLDQGQALGDDWKRYQVVFRVPVWSGPEQPVVWFRTPAATGGSGLQVLLDNVRVVET